MLERKLRKRLESSVAAAAGSRLTASCFTMENKGSLIIIIIIITIVIVIIIIIIIIILSRGNTVSF